MTEKGLVSIITPTYNHEKFLASCLDSVISQTYDSWEVIIIDDGSTDQTGVIGKDYSNKYSNIHYSFQNNIGPYRLHETYNKALAHARGEYIAILEGDDLWYPEKLRLQINELQSHADAVLSWGAAKSVHAESLKVLREHPMPQKDRMVFNNTPPGSILKELYVDNCIPALTVVIRKQALLDIGGFKKLENLPLVDYPTLLELALKGPFAYIDEFLGGWRIYPQQVTKTHTVNIRKGLQAFARQHFKSHLKDSKSILRNINWSKIEKKLKAQLVIAYARAGRYKLIQKDFKGARQDYKKAISTGVFHEPLWKLRATVGFIFSLLHRDIEGLAGKMNKTTYRD